MPGWCGLSFLFSYPAVQCTCLTPSGISQVLMPSLPEPSLPSVVNVPHHVWSLFGISLRTVCVLLSPLPTKGMFNVPLLGLSGTEAVVAYVMRQLVSANRSWYDRDPDP